MQTAYNLTPPTARAGLLYDASSSKDVVTRTAGIAVPFGCFVVKAAGDDNVKLPVASASSASIVEGVAVYTQDEQSGLTGDGVVPGYEAKRPINVLQKGRIWVYCETSFDPDADTLFLRYTANGALTIGNVRNDSDSGKADELGANGFGVAYKPLNTLAAAGFLALDLNIPAVVR